MTRPLVTYPDVERQAVDDLTDDLAELGESASVGVGVPPNWTADDGAHLQVDCDGTPVDRHPVAQFSTIRVTAWAASPTEAKRLANLAHGLLLARLPYSPLTGLLPAHDPGHDAELASFTVRATVRSEPIT